MSKRRARVAVPAARAEVGDLPASARVAWSYLAALISTLCATGLVLVANQTAAAVLCRAAEDAADCKLGWAIWLALGGFLLSLIPIALKLKLDWLLVAAMWAGVGLWVAFDAIDQWWWWVIAPLLPAASALFTADWRGGVMVRRVQVAGVVALVAAAVGALIWWYLRG
jgi:hypothetical protein